MHKTKPVLLGAILSVWMTVSAPALQTTFTATLDGPSQSPPNSSPGTGQAIVIYDNVAHTLTVQVSFEDLIGTTTAAHIHAPTSAPFSGIAPVATQTPSFAGFPLGVPSGTYDTIFDLSLASSYNASFVSSNGGTPESAEAALVQYLKDAKAYLNIHTQIAPGGEIRGFLTQAAVPDGGATLGLLSLGCLAVVIARRFAGDQWS